MKAASQDPLRHLRDVVSNNLAWLPLDAGGALCVVSTALRFFVRGVDGLARSVRGRPDGVRERVEVDAVRGVGTSLLCTVRDPGDGSKVVWQVCCTYAHQRIINERISVSANPDKVD